MRHPKLPSSIEEGMPRTAVLGGGGCFVASMRDLGSCLEPPRQQPSAAAKPLIIQGGELSECLNRGLPHQALGEFVLPVNVR
jgi:hypothetical protein